MTFDPITTKNTVYVSEKYNFSYAKRDEDLDKSKLNKNEIFENIFSLQTINLNWDLFNVLSIV